VILKKLGLKRFACFQDFEASFEPGLNVIKGPNEAGKSTLCSALLTALFTNPKTTAQMHRLKRSWGSDEMYEITLEFQTHEGRSYRLVKDFEAGTSKLVCLDDGESIIDRDEVDAWLKELLGLGSEALFKSSAFIGQGEVTLMNSGEIGPQLEKVITGGGAGVASEALRRLDEAISEMERGLYRPATYPGDLKKIQDRIDELRSKLATIRKGVEEAERCRGRLIEIEEELTRAQDDLQIKRGLKEKCDKRAKIEDQLNDLRSREKQLEQQMELARQMEVPALGWPIAGLLIGGLLFVIGAIGALLTSGSLQLLSALMGFVGSVIVCTSFIWYRRQQERQQKVREAKSSLQELEEDRKEISRQRRDAEEKLEEAGLAQASLKPEEYERLTQEIANLEANISRLEEERIEKRTVVERAPYDVEDVHRLEEELAEAQQQLEQKRERHDVYQLAREFIAKAQAAAMTSAKPLLEERMSRYLAHITEGRYTKVEVDEKTLGFRVSCGTAMLSPIEDVFGGTYYNLSQGTIDQLYLAARLALVEIIAGGRYPPLIFDDPFVRFDAERMKRAMKLCLEVASKHQILLFTCRNDYDQFARHIIRL